MLIHGDSKRGQKTGEYRIWCNLRNRCQNPNNPSYANYGGRGIQVCDRWNDFENFLSDMGRRPSAKHSIERVDNSGPYAPDNCVWIPKGDQNKNKRNVKQFTYQGETLHLSDWARRFDVSMKLLYKRIYEYGWSFEKALTEPKRLAYAQRPIPTKGYKTAVRRIHFLESGGV